MDVNDFSLVSGYKINENKCKSLIIGAQIHSIIKECYNFKWEIISKKLEDLYENNYCKLEKKIRQDLRRWSLIPNGIYSRVETIKMMVLPQLLFLVFFIIME